MAVFQAWLMAVPGAEKKLPQACSTVVLVNAFSRPPITMAVKMARKITVTELPSRIDSLRVWPNDLRLASLFSFCFVAVVGPGEPGEPEEPGEPGDSGGPGGGCSLMSSLPLLPAPLPKTQPPGFRRFPIRPSAGRVPQPAPRAAGGR